MMIADSIELPSRTTVDAAATAGGAAVLGFREASVAQPPRVSTNTDNSNFVRHMDSSVQTPMLREPGRMAEAVRSEPVDRVRRTTSKRGQHMRMIKRFAGLDVQRAKVVAVRTAST
jgi:hypothetical protein